MQQGVPRTVVALGFVSLCMDTSSELIHSLLPVFLVAGLGASPLALGLIEGAAEGVASVMRVFSGALSDRSGRRRRPRAAPPTGCARRWTRWARCWGRRSRSP